MEYVVHIFGASGVDMRSCAMHDVWQRKLGCPLLVLNGGADLKDNFAKVKEALR